MSNPSKTAVGGRKTWAIAGVLLLVLGAFFFTPLGRVLRDWWTHQRDKRLYGVAYQAWEAGRFEEAKDECALILQNDPAFDEALVLTGKYYAEKAVSPDWEKAADFESRALAIQKDFPTLLAYGGSLWKLKKYGDSEKILRDCLQQDPRNPEVYEQLGWVLVCEKQYLEASRVYGEGLGLDPDNRKMKGWRREALKRLSGKG
jgi:tetratricopeptide (TPR) repeat protein